jgi:hypothetical protein
MYIVYRRLELRFTEIGYDKSSPIIITVLSPRGEHNGPGHFIKTLKYFKFFSRQFSGHSSQQVRRH